MNAVANGMKKFDKQKKKPQETWKTNSSDLGNIKLFSDKYQH